MAFRTATQFTLKFVTTRAERVVLFSVVSVCVFVCLSVSLSVNTITHEPLETDIITKFSGHYPMI